MLGRGDMCSFNLRDLERRLQRRLLKKLSAWPGSLHDVVMALSVLCSCNQKHGRCMGGSVTRKVYGPALVQLARASEPHVGF